MDRIKSKHPTELALLNNGSSLHTSSAATCARTSRQEEIQEKNNSEDALFFLKDLYIQIRTHT